MNKSGRSLNDYYCINVVLCSAYFITIYIVLLEREKMHRFNRFYLLFTIVLAFIIPLVKIQLKSAPVEIADVAEVVYATGETIKTTIAVISVPLHIIIIYYPGC